jgi:hypothetical protein
MTAARASFIHIGHGAGPRRVFHVQVGQIEAGQTDKFINLAVQMAVPIVNQMRALLVV